MKYLIKNLIFLKNDRNLTQDNIAVKLNVQRTLVGSWLEFRSIPQTAELKKLSDLFKVSIDWLIKKDIERLSKRKADAILK